MANVLTLVRKGGRMVEDMSDVRELVEGLVGENEALKLIIEKQGAVIVAIKDEIGVLSRKLDAIQDEVTINKKTTEEIKTTKFYGQAVKLLPQAIERAKKMSGDEVRRLIHSAAKAHPSGRRKGYTHIYEKLFEVTGFDVYKVGKISLGKKDNVDGWSKDPTYINAIFKQGLYTEVAVICMQIIADK